MLGLWALLTLIAALYSAWQGYGGRAFAATLTAFAFYFLVMLLFAARGVEDRLALRRRQRLLARHRSVSCLPDLRLGDKYFRVHAFRSCRRCRIHSAGAGRLRRTSVARSMAGFPDPRGNMGGSQAVTESLGMVILALALALPWRPPRLRFHRATVRERRPRDILASSPRHRHRLFGRLGLPLELVHPGEFHCFRLHRHSAGTGHALHRVSGPVGSVVGYMVEYVEIASRSFHRHSVFYRLARRVFLPRSAAKYAFPSEQERSRGLVDSLHSLRLLAHHEQLLSQLALRDPGLHRGHFLRLDLAQNRLDLRLGPRPYRRRRHLAPLLSNTLELISSSHKCLSGIARCAFQEGSLHDVRIGRLDAGSSVTKQISATSSFTFRNPVFRGHTVKAVNTVPRTTT